MFSPMGPFELLDLFASLAGIKRQPEERPRWKPLVGGYVFGIVGAALGVKLASRLETGGQTGYVLMVVAGLVGFLAFLTGWRRVVG